MSDDSYKYTASGQDEVPVSAEVEELARRAGVRPKTLSILDEEHLRGFREMLDHDGAWHAAWGWLEDQIHDTLTTSGFQRNDPSDISIGGYAIAAAYTDEGVMISWVTVPYDGKTYDTDTEAVMQAALKEILALRGYTVRQIPDSEDDGGSLIITGRSGAARNILPRESSD